jgi:hypothetical protein
MSNINKLQKRYKNNKRRTRIQETNKFQDTNSKLSFEGLRKKGTNDSESLGFGAWSLFVPCILVSCIL